MSASLDLSLPRKSPKGRPGRQDDDDGLFAVYSLVNLGDGGFNQLKDVLNSNKYTSLYSWRFPPQCDFVGHPLKDVYEYHLELSNKDATCHPTLFVLVHKQGYKKDGVLLVNLDTDLKCTVDMCRCGAEEAILTLINLQIANEDWEEFKENELSTPVEEVPAEIERTTISLFRRRRSYDRAKPTVHHRGSDFWRLHNCGRGHDRAPEVAGTRLVRQTAQQSAVRRPRQLQRVG